MGRRKLDIPRDRQFNIGLTAGELADLHRAARIANQRPVDYARTRLFAKLHLSARAVAAVPALDPVLVMHLARIGNNLNQIARRLHELTLPVPDDLQPLLDELRALLRRVHSP